ncbi:Predicted pyrophosphatase or phosphodiesterase, AlkP superfamily [Sanguibacter gelidistatuariae]|uniref:Predicted pyrophosphatase or phosphodiesterase, AlkP superfamily n=1 Tax=Sanguibacter gelidistatuariae TaxID=1814289 RepID=A0A1G6RH14_9MICO|nr:alkaline phosphatase family protein [Sanguibacter gelidistatuariae]SDD03731.1 Predicted pyrophosphatase or phosphodiesterase, AlkP superfamily [Sanguibacter gelidistatuariae]
MIPGPTTSLTDAARSLGFLLPDSGGRSLSAVLPAVAGSLGVTDGAGRFGAAQRLLRLAPAERVCVVLIDGLGFENLTERSGHAPFMRSLLADGGELTCGFPSTTAVSMGIFGTGTGPGRTGLLGYTVRNPHTGALANMVSWTGLGAPEDVQREGTVFEAITGAGIAVTTVGPAKFAQSGMTRAALRGGRYWNAESLADRVDAASYELISPGLVYLYWGDVDKIGHHEGARSWQWGDALEAADREIERLARTLPSGTRLIITADHGMVDVDVSKRWDVAQITGLSEGVKIVAGEPRAVHVYSRKASGAPAVAARWRDVLGDGALVATRDEVIDAGWLGPVSDHVAPYIGDVIVALTGAGTVVDSRTQSAASLGLRGVHGSLTPREMRIPYLTLSV